MKELDPGHLYKLDCYDGEVELFLQFMKRVGEKYPGNTNTYPGTNCQEVIRALIARMKYLNNQAPSEFNKIIIGKLRDCLMAFEERAAERHGRSLLRIEDTIACKVCGHIQCNCQ